MHSIDVNPLQTVDREPIENVVVSLWEEHKERSVFFSEMKNKPMKTSVTFSSDHQRTEDQRKTTDRLHCDESIYLLGWISRKWMKNKRCEITKETSSRENDSSAGEMIHPMFFFSQGGARLEIGKNHVFQVYF